MKARDVVGRKIVGIRQERVWNAQTNSFTMTLESLQLDNGASILFMTEELQFDYAIRAWVKKP